MTANEISVLVNNSNDLSSLSYSDYLGHVGILIGHAFLHDIPMDKEVLSRYLKVDEKDIETPLSRLNMAGIFNKYSWFYKSKNSMLKMSPKKLEECMLAWSHIAAISSGYIECLPNPRYIAASEIYKIAIS
jgi:hypothetical protein